MIKADANRQEGIEGTKGLPPELSSRSMEEYLAVLDDAAFGAATEVTPKFFSPADPSARWTAAHGGQAFFAYSTDYLIDLNHAVIVDVEASTAVRKAETAAAKTVIERTQERLDLYPERLAADTAYGSAEMLGWLVHERGIEPHVPVFDRSKRRDGTFSREDFAFDVERDLYTCPGSKTLQHNFKTRRTGITKAGTRLYRASQSDCQICALKERCCAKAPMRKIPRSTHEGARGYGPRHRQNRCLRHVTAAAQEGGNVVRPLEAHPEPRPLTIERALWCPR